MKFLSSFRIPLLVPTSTSFISLTYGNVTETKMNFAIYDSDESDDNEEAIDKSSGKSNINNVSSTDDIVNSWISDTEDDNEAPKNDSHSKVPNLPTNSSSTGTAIPTAADLFNSEFAVVSTIQKLSTGCRDGMKLETFKRQNNEDKDKAEVRQAHATSTPTVSIRVPEDQNDRDFTRRKDAIARTVSSVSSSQATTTLKKSKARDGEQKKETAKDRVKRQRLSGQSGIGPDFRVWKSDQEMVLRQQFD